MSAADEQPAELVQAVRLVVTCPSCGALYYEFDLDCDELGSHISIPCDECPNEIDVNVSVLVQSIKRGDDPWLPR